MSWQDQKFILTVLIVQTVQTVLPVQTVQNVRTEQAEETVETEETEETVLTEDLKKKSNYSLTHSLTHFQLENMRCQRI